MFLSLQFAQDITIIQEGVEGFDEFSQNFKIKLISLEWT